MNSRKRRAVFVPGLCLASAILFFAVSGLRPSAEKWQTEPQPIAARPYTDRLESYTVRDGDTLTQCTIDLGYGVVLRDSVRIVGIDTPEITGEHKAAGLVVRDAVREWLGSHKELWLIGRGRGELYGRILGDVQPLGAGQSLSAWLLAKGYAKHSLPHGKRPEWTKAELERIVDGAD